MPHLLGYLSHLPPVGHLRHGRRATTTEVVAETHERIELRLRELLIPYVLPDGVLGIGYPVRQGRIDLHQRDGSPQFFRRTGAKMREGTDAIGANARLIGVVPQYHLFVLTQGGDSSRTHAHVLVCHSLHLHRTARSRLPVPAFTRSHVVYARARGKYTWKHVPSTGED